MRRPSWYRPSDFRLSSPPSVSSLTRRWVVLAGRSASSAISVRPSGRVDFSKAPSTAITCDVTVLRGVRLPPAMGWVRFLVGWVHVIQRVGDYSPGTPGCEDRVDGASG